MEMGQQKKIWPKQNTKEWNQGEVLLYWHLFLSFSWTAFVCFLPQREHSMYLCNVKQILQQKKWNWKPNSSLRSVVFSFNNSSKTFASSSVKFLSTSQNDEKKKLSNLDAKIETNGMLNLLTFCCVSKHHKSFLCHQSQNQSQCRLIVFEIN